MGDKHKILSDAHDALGEVYEKIKDLTDMKVSFKVQEVQSAVAGEIMKILEEVNKKQ